MSAAISSAVLAKAGKLLITEIRKWAKSRGKPLGEWRGALKFEELGKNRWKVHNPSADPCRLWVPAAGLEYAWADGFVSDGPTIPDFACRALECKRTDFLRSGFLHDYAYEFGSLLARPEGRQEWSRVEVTKHEADVLLRVGVNAEGATRGQEAAIYAGVKSSFALAAWRKCRTLDHSDVEQQTRKEHHA